MRCAINDAECVPGRLRLGKCEVHYRRQRRTGTTANLRVDNFARHILAPSGCWIYSPVYPNGYGKLTRRIHGTRLAHRAYYTELVGPIPEGMDLDHLCRRRECVRPLHLQPVSRAVNLRRGHEARTHCEKGLHELTPANVRPGTRQCLPCWRARYRAAGARYRQRQRQRAA